MSLIRDPILSMRLKVFILPCNMHVFPAMSGTWPAEIQFSSADQRIFAVGRMSPQRGWPGLVDLPADHPWYRFQHPDGAAMSLEHVDPVRVENLGNSLGPDDDSTLPSLFPKLILMSFQLLQELTYRLVVK